MARKRVRGVKAPPRGLGMEKEIGRNDTTNIHARPPEGSADYEPLKNHCFDILMILETSLAVFFKQPACEHPEQMRVDERLLGHTLTCL